jgi:hypothetical protein
MTKLGKKVWSVERYSAQGTPKALMDVVRRSEK